MVDEQEDNIQELAINFINSKSSKDFSKLYNKLINGLKYFIIKTSSNTFDIDTVNEIMARTFSKVIFNIHMYDYRKAMFITWIYTIARNEIMNEFRSIKNRLYLNDIIKSSDEETSVTIELSDLSNVNSKYDTMSEFKDIIGEKEDREKRRNIMVLICHEIDHNLSYLYRDILIDREIHNMMYKDLSKKYNLPINTIKSRIKIGRTFIKNAIINEVRKINKEV